MRYPWYRFTKKYKRDKLIAERNKARLDLISTVNSQLSKEHKVKYFELLIPGNIKDIYSVFIRVPEFYSSKSDDTLCFYGSYKSINIKIKMMQLSKDCGQRIYKHIGGKLQFYFRNKLVLHIEEYEHEYKIVRNVKTITRGVWFKHFYYMYNTMPSIFP